MQVAVILLSHQCYGGDDRECVAFERGTRTTDVIGARARDEVPDRYDPRWTEHRSVLESLDRPTLNTTYDERARSATRGGLDCTDDDRAGERHDGDCKLRACYSERRAMTSATMQPLKSDGKMMRDLDAPGGRRALAGVTEALAGMSECWTRGPAVMVRTLAAVECFHHFPPGATNRTTARGIRLEALMDMPRAVPPVAGGVRLTELIQRLSTRAQT